MCERNYLDVEEFCVSEDARRQGVGRGMIDFIRKPARQRVFGRVGLNMWEFNQDALVFYENVGFTSFCRYMELPVDKEDEKCL